jgi:hypothetical protein
LAEIARPEAAGIITGTIRIHASSGRAHDPLERWGKDHDRAACSGGHCRGRPPNAALIAWLIFTFRGRSVGLTLSRLPKRAWHFRHSKIRIVLFLLGPNIANAATNSPPKPGALIGSAPGFLFLRVHHPRERPLCAKRCLPRQVLLCPEPNKSKIVACWRSKEGCHSRSPSKNGRTSVAASDTSSPVRCSPRLHPARPHR